MMKYGCSEEMTGGKMSEVGSKVCKDCMCTVPHATVVYLPFIFYILLAFVGRVRSSHI